MCDPGDWLRKHSRKEKVFPIELYFTPFFTSYALMRMERHANETQKGGGRK